MEPTLNENALVNELKGILFEYLVASKIAANYKIQTKFNSDLCHVFKRRLQQYQLTLLKMDSNLYDRIFLYADQTCQKIINELSLEKVVSVYLMGKDHEEKVGESDIILKTESGDINISLKLLKKSAFINTKSAGVNSFLKKYFDSEELQEKVNQNYLQIFDEFSLKIASKAGVELKHNLSETWKENNLPDRPGILSEEFKPILFQYYGQVKNEILRSVIEVQNKSSKTFNDGLSSLIGFSKSDIIKVVFEYEKNKLGNCNIFKLPKSKLNPEIVKTESNTSFLVRCEKILVQFRVKPMNKFTVPGIKLNISVRHIDD